MLGRYLVAAVTLCAATPALAINENAVAVLDIQGTGVAPDLLPTLTEILTAELAAVGSYKVIAGRDIQSMLGFEKQKDVLGCTDAACLAEIGGALGVDRIVASHIGRVGSTYVVNIKLINIRMADTEARVYETVRGEDDALIQTVRTSVQKLLGKSVTPEVARSAPPTGKKPKAAPPPPPVEEEEEADHVAHAEPSPTTHARAESGGRKLGVGPLVLFGVGAVGGGLGIAMGLSAKSAAKNANEPGFVGGQLESEKAKRRASISTAGFVGGGLAAAGGLVWWLLSGSSDDHAAVAPLLSTEAVGVAFGGSF